MTLQTDLIIKDTPDFLSLLFPLEFSQEGKPLIGYLEHGPCAHKASDAKNSYLIRWNKVKTRLVKVGLWVRRAIWQLKQVP